MQSEFRNPVLWVVLVAIGILLSVAGAFGTSEILRPVPLSLYWIGVTILTYAVGSFVATACYQLFKTLYRWVRVALTGVLIGLAVFPVIVLLNTALFGQIFDHIQELVGFALTVICTTVVVTFILDVIFEATNASNRQSNETENQQPPLMDRLPFDIRGSLVSISVEDHYVRIRTLKGEEMVLMRLGDAIKETHPTAGLQVHRSHWVAIDAIASASRNGNGAVLVMKNGPDIPVSRSNVARIRDAGLLGR